jgi:pSer/pThr/pTyr-binding forkhead associated (FHA) protein
MNGYFLVRGTDPDGSDRIELGDATIVGRSDDCDLKVSDGHPSRRHAQLTVENGELWVEDLGSANGTFVNDRQVSEKTRLQHGDRLAFDLAVFAVAAPAASTDDEATVVRRVDEDGDATVVRPPPAAAERGAETNAAGSAGAEETAPEDPGPAPAAGDAGGDAPRHVPKSWADPDYQPAGTRVLSPEELKAMAAGGAAPGADESAVAGPHLAVINGQAAGTVLELSDSGDEWTVGTDADRDLTLADEGISAFHAKISQDNGRWRVIDQMSANGTFVNGDKVTVSYLGNGDRVQFAQVECEIRLPAATQAAKPAAAGGASSSRTWLIAVIAAAATIGVLALASLFG